MDWNSIPLYFGVGIAVSICARLARSLRVPASLIVAILGLLVGRTGVEWIAPADAQRMLPAVLVHLAIVLLALGVQLGAGLLRRTAREIAGRLTGPFVFATVSFLVAIVALPALLPDAETERAFHRFHLPLAFVFAVFPLLAVRDLQGAPTDVGAAHALVAGFLLGAVHSFAPKLLWGALDPGDFWRTPILVLGESGALGVAAAVLFLFTTRRLRVPWFVVAPVLAFLVVEAAFRAALWVPFSGLGAGLVLGRAGMARAAESSAPLFSPLPFLAVAALAFAPDLFRQALVVPVLIYAGALAAFVLVARLRLGPDWVTGPGLLFLGLTLVVRLDGRMSPLTRYTVDFALPAWMLLRLLVEGLERRERRHRPHCPS